jgi:hypothetical protein
MQLKLISHVVVSFRVSVCQQLYHLETPDFNLTFAPAEIFP